MAVAIASGFSIDGASLISGSGVISVPGPRNLQLVGQRCGIAGGLGSFNASGSPFLMNRSRHLIPGGADAISLVYSGLYLNPQEASCPPGCFQALNVTYSGGSGYAVGDIDVFNGTNTTAMAPVKVRIEAVASGVPTIVQVIDGGLIVTPIAAGTAPSTTSGSGTGATATFTWNAGAYGVRVSIEQVWGQQTFQGPNPIEPASLGSKGDGQININVLVPLGGKVQTDLIPVNVPVGGAIAIRGVYVGAQSVPYSRYAMSSSLGSASSANYEYALASTTVFGTTDIAVSNTSVGAAASNNLLQPLLILGIPKVPLPTIIGIGDSRNAFYASGAGAITGTVDPQDSDGNQGPFEKTYASTGPVFWPWANLARGSDRLSYAIPSTNSTVAGRVARLAALKLAQPLAVFLNLSVNDFINQETSAAVLAYEQQLVQEIRGCGVKYVFTETTDPNTTSTDSWATTTNQTLAQNQSTNIAARNAALAAGTYGAGYDFFIDQRPNVEFFTGGAYTGKWIAGATGDGIHATTAVIAQKVATAQPVIAANIVL